MPPAPALFSTTIVWPRYFSVAVASARITWSVDPPAGQGTISVTGRDGNAWANATDDRSDGGADDEPTLQSLHDSSWAPRRSCAGPRASAPSIRRWRGAERFVRGSRVAWIRDVLPRPRAARIGREGRGSADRRPARPPRAGGSSARRPGSGGASGRAGGTGRAGGIARSRARPRARGPRARACGRTAAALPSSSARPAGRSSRARRARRSSGLPPIVGQRSRPPSASSATAVRRHFAHAMQLSSVPLSKHTRSVARAASQDATIAVLSTRECDGPRARSARGSSTVSCVTSPWSWVGRLKCWSIVRREQHPRVAPLERERGRRQHRDARALDDVGRRRAACASGWSSPGPAPCPARRPRRCIRDAHALERRGVRDREVERSRARG